MYFVFDDKSREFVVHISSEVFDCEIPLANLSGAACIIRTQTCE